MASARIAQLLSQRAKYSGYGKFSGSTRIIGVSSLAQQTASIAKKAVSTEIEDRVQKYNDGQISNEEMRKFLSDMQINPLLSSTEKVDISNKIRDFDDRIAVEKLTSVYKAAPENSATKIQAAQAVARYYQGKAATLQVDTPAYSTAMQNAAQWTSTAQTVQDNSEKSARKLKRATLLNEVAQYQPNSLEEAQQKAQAYDTLAQQAQADGDVTEAVQFQTQAQAARNEIPQIQARMERAAETEQKQATAETRRGIITNINEIANAYHDGKISAQEFAQAIPELEAMAVEIGDTSIQLSLNKWSDTLAKDVAKGVKRGSFEGLPTVLGRGKGTGGGGVQTTWDKQDFDYSDNIRLAKAALDAGKINAQKYTDLVGKSIEERANQLQDRIQTVYDIAKENPNAKIVFEGKKQRAADVLEGLYKADEEISGQVQAYENNTFAIAMVPPNQFTKTGDVRKKGKSTATFEIIDTTNLPQGQYVKDKQGIYHQILKDKFLLKPQDLINVQGEGQYAVYVDPNDPSKFYSVKTDDAGNPYIERGNQYVQVYDAGSNQSKRVDIQPGQTEVDDYATLAQKEAQAVIQKKQTMQPGQTNANTQQIQKENNPIQSTADFVQKSVMQNKPAYEAAKNIAATVFPGAPIIKAGIDFANTAKDVVAPAAAEIAKVIAPRMPEIPKELGQSQEAVASIPQGTKINMPAVSMPNQGTVAQPAPVQPKIQVAVPKTTPVQQMAKTTGTTIKIPAPNVPSNIAAQAKPQNYSIQSGINSLANALKGTIGKLKFW